MTQVQKEAIVIGFVAGVFICSVFWAALTIWGFQLHKKQ